MDVQAERKRISLELAQEAYYAVWNSVGGKILPQWDDLDDEQRQRFIDAVDPLFPLQIMLVLRERGR